MRLSNADSGKEGVELAKTVRGLRCQVKPRLLEYVAVRPQIVTRLAQKAEELAHGAIGLRRLKEDVRVEEDARARG